MKNIPFSKLPLFIVFFVFFVIRSFGQSTQADFSLSLSPNPGVFPGYPSTGVLNARLTYPSNASDIPANSVAVILTAGGAVIFDITNYTPPVGWAILAGSTDPTNVVIYNTAALVYQPTPLTFTIPTKATSAGSTTVGGDVQFLNEWSDPVSSNNQPVITVTVANVALPVTLMSFLVVKENTVAQLSWSTTEETNSDRFEVEHSINAKSWISVGTVASNGESRIRQNYTFRHESPSSGVNYYRLKMIDKDESFAYSGIRNVNFDNLNQLSVFPNPVSDKLFVQEPENVKSLQLINMAGQVNFYQNSAAKNGIDVKNLNPGIYMLKVVRQDNSASQHKVVIYK